MKTVVFDLDGTLLDSSQRHVIVLKDCLASLGYLEVPTGYLEFKADGNSTKRFLLDRMQLEPGECRRISELWEQRIEQKEYLMHDLLFDDAIPALKECIKKGYKLFLVSARQNKKNFIWQIKRLRLERFFEGIYCVSPKDAVQGKTQQIQALKADFIVGDTESEWKAAVAANISYYILNRGFRSQRYWNMQGVKSYVSLWPLLNLF